MIWLLTQILFWWTAYLLMGGLTLAIGALLRMPTNNALQALAVVLLWPAFAMLLIVHGALLAFVSGYLTIRHLRKGSR